MACEELAANFDNMALLYQQAETARAAGMLEYQQLEWASWAAMGAWMMAGVMLEDCLRGQNGLRAPERMIELFRSPEKLKEKISELHERHEKAKK
jgi:hypothetical protein